MTNIESSAVIVIPVFQTQYQPIVIGGFDDHITKSNFEIMTDGCQFPGCSFHPESNKYCARHQMYAGTAKAKAAPKPIAKVSEKKKRALKEAKPKKDALAEWFTDKVSHLTGTCMECGGSTKNSIYVYAKACVAHVLPKRNTMFPSVATHEDNHLELCTENGCHHRYDNSWEDAAEMKVWPLAVEKFKKIFPYIAPAERKNIPDILLQEIEPEFSI